MTKRRPSIRQADVTRALKAALGAGLTPTRAEITAEGVIALSFGAPEPATPATALDAWRAKRGTRPA